MPALNPSAVPQRGFRLSTWVHITGATAVILYGILAVTQGLAQQAQGLPPDRIDCDYRVQLLRDRVIAHTERSLLVGATFPEDHVLPNLIRETRAACVQRGDLESAHRLDVIAELLDDLLQSRKRVEQAKRELFSP